MMNLDFVFCFIVILKNLDLILCFKDLIYFLRVFLLLFIINIFNIIIYKIYKIKVWKNVRVEFINLYILLI